MRKLSGAALRYSSKTWISELGNTDGGRLAKLIELPFGDDGTLSLETAFGTAEFSPATLTEKDFDASGKAIVKVLVRGTKTMVPVIRGAFEATGQPMIHVSRQRPVVKEKGAEPPT